MKKSIMLLLLIGVSNAFAQHTNFNYQKKWSLNKKEIFFGLGATQFLGDLGGQDQAGSDYNLRDIDLPATSFASMVGYRYRFRPHWATSTVLNVAMVSGDDKNTKDIIRNSRNLHFRSMIIELQQRLEFIVFSNEKVGNRHNINSHRRKSRGRNEQLYVFSGAGISYFNPKAKYNGKWVALRPLSTEGQVFGKAEGEVLGLTATIPFGLGLRMGLGSFWRLGIEASYIKTFTDYIDDVHGKYFDPAILASEIGPEAAYLSNPSTQNTSWFAPGQQRGDIENDAYFYLNLTLARNLTYKNYAKQRKKMVKRGKYRF